MLTSSLLSLRTTPTVNPSEDDIRFMNLAVDEARKGASEGGVPIGACLVSKEGKVLGVGRNKRVQEGSVIKHGETDCLENVGRLQAAMYKGCTMYTTLSPCTMCTGAILLFGIGRVVIGENETFLGGEGILKEFGVETVNLDLNCCKEMMKDLIESNPDLWNEDIGE